MSDKNVIYTALYSDDGDVTQALSKKADDAMYMSRGFGKNRYTFVAEKESVL